MTRLPPLADAVADGRLGWTKAQLVARVATPGTVAQWLARAESLGRRELSTHVHEALGRARRK